MSQLPDDHKKYKDMMEKKKVQIVDLPLNNPESKVLQLVKKFMQNLWLKKKKITMYLPALFVYVWSISTSRSYPEAKASPR